MTTTLRFALILALLMICPLTTTLARAELAESGTVAGTVTEKSLGGFQLTHDGATTRFLTGRETQFDPADYRPQTGDTVSVTYYSKTMRGGTVELAASQVKLNAANPDRKELKSPADGQVAEVGRKMIKINFPAEKTTMGLEKQRSTEYMPADWKPEVGDSVTVHFSKIPSRFGNTYVYVIDKIEKK